MEEGEKNHRRGEVKGKRVKGGDTRERIIPMHHTGGESKEEKKTQVVFFLCCHQGIEIWGRKKSRTGQAKE